MPGTPPPSHPGKPGVEGSARPPGIREVIQEPAVIRACAGQVDVLATFHPDQHRLHVVASRDSSYRRESLGGTISDAVGPVELRPLLESSRSAHRSSASALARPSYLCLESPSWQVGLRTLRLAGALLRAIRSTTHCSGVVRFEASGRDHMRSFFARGCRGRRCSIAADFVGRDALQPAEWTSPRRGSPTNVSAWVVCPCPASGRKHCAPTADTRGAEQIAPRSTKTDPSTPAPATAVSLASPPAGAPAAATQRTFRPTIVPTAPTRTPTSTTGGSPSPNAARPSAIAVAIATGRNCPSPRRDDSSAARWMLVSARR